jgi:cobalt-zinc-cadmium efflux system membrane fusion protein
MRVAGRDLHCDRAEGHAGEGREEQFMASVRRSPGRSGVVRFAVFAAVAVAGLAGSYFVGFFPALTASTLSTARAAGEASSARAAIPSPTASLTADSVNLEGEEAKTVTVEGVGERVFPITRETIGNIDFNQDNSLQVFTSYPGRITQLLAKAGDDVKKGQALFYIDSPDLSAAESTLIQTAAQLELTTKGFNRARELVASKGMAQKDLEQATSDHKTAEGNHAAARNAVRIFGKSDAEMNQIIATHRVDSQMPVPSPTDGRVTARSAAVGLYVQPGNTPAPYTVSDISTMWMLASVPEAEIPLLRLGQEVDVKVMALPDRIFTGKIINIGASVDPGTHRILVRSEVPDPNHELRAQMFATFVIRTGDAVKSPAIPESGVVREGDGTMSAWVTTDGHRFTRRTIKIGLQQAGFDQVLDGLKPGERVAADGAVFLSNALTSASQ